MLRKPAINVDECWPDWKFWFELAKRMGYEDAFPWRSVEDAIEYQLKPSGLSLKALSDEGLFYADKRYRKYEVEGFKTPSGKVEIYSEVLAAAGFSPLPTYTPVESYGVGSPEYPLILVTGSRSPYYVHSQLRVVERLRRLEPEPVAEVHPSTAEECGLRDGDEALIETKVGGVEMKIRVSEAVPPKLVYAPHGWEERNINKGTDHRVRDPISGFPVLKAVPCRLRPVSKPRRPP